MGMELKLKSEIDNLKLLDKVSWLCHLAERSIWGGCKIAEIAKQYT